ncbi:helix-turn-helix domain-containing protein [Haloferacaceae archaeon DSL9]
MSATIVEVNFPVEEFALNATLETLPNATFEIERIAAHDSDRIMPLIWVAGYHEPEMTEAIDDDPSVETYEMLAQVDDEILYQMEWVDQIETLVEILTEGEGTILAASGNQDRWDLRVLFPNHENISTTHEYCKQNGLTLNIKRIYELDDGREGRFGLTDNQQSALSLAFEHGYYDVPRQSTLGDLAAELDISHQALSERLRRAEHQLIKNTIIIDRSDITS